MSRVTVKVLLNEDTNFLSGYRPGNRLVEAVAFEIDMPPDAAWEQMVLEAVFTQLNVDTPQEDWAIDYRARRNRSLSCGDVVCLGETAWTCAMVGWDQVTLVDYA